MMPNGELVIDNFAGGGGASTGIEAAIGRAIDYAINHAPPAMAIHEVNHPDTVHIVQNIWKADPRDVAQGRPIGLAWFSPDCRHFSKAKGGQPVKQNIRDLAWVVIHWAKLVKPRVIMLENVEEWRDWGPLVLGIDGVTLMPCPDRKGETFRRWVRELKREGYVIEWRELRASDYGAPTSRKRLFLIARCDGQPIVWPKPTHGPGRIPYRTAAECIDWTIPCPSIFTRERPLADATLRRIARGVQRFVLDAAKPFIVPITHRGDDRIYAIDEPLRTITTAPRGEQALVTPIIAGLAHGDFATRPGGRCYRVDEPVKTIHGSGRNQSLVAAFLAQHNSGMVGHPMTKPVSTIIGKGCTQQLVSAFIKRDFGTSTGAPATDPLPTITTDGGGHASLVAAFLIKYFGTAIGQDIADPLDTATSKGRFGLVTVTIEGVPYVVVDIGMRMLTPRELFRAQGFPEHYIIDPIFEGKRLPKTLQIKACGNSVCPPIAEALVRANYVDVEQRRVA